LNLAVYKHHFQIGNIRRIRSFEIQTGNSPQFFLM
jgi:hypothetical protein